MLMEEMNVVDAAMSDSEAMVAGATAAGVIIGVVVVLGLITLC